MLTSAPHNNIVPYRMIASRRDASLGSSIAGLRTDTRSPKQPRIPLGMRPQFRNPET